MCRCFVLDDSFANPNQDISISDITHATGGLVSNGVETTNNMLSVSLENPTAGQAALLETLNLWYIDLKCHDKDESYANYFFPGERLDGLFEISIFRRK